MRGLPANAMNKSFVNAWPMYNAVGWGLTLVLVHLRVPFGFISYCTDSILHYSQKYNRNNTLLAQSYIRMLLIIIYMYACLLKKKRQRGRISREYFLHSFAHVRANRLSNCTGTTHGLSQERGKDKKNDQILDFTKPSKPLSQLNSIIFLN